jgi:hypothetical protein
MITANYNKITAFKTILFAWLIAGSLDILSAFVDYYLKSGKGPAGVLKFIASGIFGKEAFDNDSMIWIGLLLHFTIALLFTIIFFLLYPRLKFLRINIALSAVIIGIFIWLIMNRVVVPLSNTPKYPFNPVNAIKAVLILIFMIGLPLSVIFKRYYAARLNRKAKNI